MIHTITKNSADRFIRFCDDAYLFVEVYGSYKNIREDDTVLLTREGRVCRYKVHCIQYFTPHSEEFFGKLLWVEYVYQ